MVEPGAGLEEIKVSADAEGNPLDLLRRGTRLKVLRIYDHWRIFREWWKSEIRRDYFRVETTGGMVYEICRDLVADQWYLSKR